MPVPRPSDPCATPDEPEAYERWFRAKVHASLADSRPVMSHAAVMAESQQIIAAAEQKRAVRRKP